MFSGFISDCGSIQKIKKTDNGMQLEIACNYPDLERGESIAVNGTCLTVTEQGNGYFCCDLSPETLKCTSASDLALNDKVNLERSLTLNDRLHGHIVMGHVDQVCTVEDKQASSEFVCYRFSGADPIYLVPKGSIAINGVSLTLNKVEDISFEVMLIPETLHKTNLSDLSVGERVNIEYDYFAKLISKQIQLIKNNT